MTSLTPEDAVDRSRHLLRSFVALAVVLGLCQAWTARHLMNIDGISYVDVAAAYARGDWSAAISAYWNPLYTWMLAGMFAVLEPSPLWEFPTAHLLSLGIYVCVIACFHLFLREFIKHDRERRRNDSGTGWQRQGLPTSAWIALGYSTFIYSSIELVGVDVVSPDLCVAGLIYLAAALLLRLYTTSAAVGSYFVLGACLAFAYLAKVATALPVILSFGLGAILAPAARRRVWIRAVALGIGFLLIAAPWVVVLSQRQGHFTVSEAGRLNYAWFVNWIPSDHWLGEIPGAGQPVHPHKKIFEKPAAYAYDHPVQGTLPGWYDPVYWNEGIRLRFDPGRQLYVIYMNTQELARALFGGSVVALVGGMLALYVLDRRWRFIGRNLGGVWFLLSPALATFVMYLLVHLEARFLGATVPLLVLGLLAGLSQGERTDSNVLTAIVGAAVVMTLVPVAVGTAFKAYQFGMDPPIQWQVADHLRRSGVEPGDRIGALGQTNRSGWARLARVQITAEIPFSSERDYRTASDAVKTEVLDALFSTGVKAIVSDHRQGTGCRSGWRALGNTGFYLCTPSADP